MPYSYDYPRAMNTVDIVVFNQHKDSILLIERKNEPFKNHWAFPGGFIEMEEDLIDSAKRELKEETGITNIKLEQFKSYGKPGRDPRGRNISTVFWGIFIGNSNEIKAGDDAASAKWFPVNKLPLVGFDHEIILKDILLEVM